MVQDVGGLYRLKRLKMFNDSEAYALPGQVKMVESRFKNFFNYGNPADRSQHAQEPGIVV